MKKILILIFVLSLVGCGASQITKAYNTANAVTAGYNNAGDILKAIPWTEEQKPKVEAADKALHDAIAAAWAAVYQFKAGEANADKVEVAFGAVLAALEEFDQLVDNETFKAIVSGIKHALELYLEIKTADAPLIQPLIDDLNAMEVQIGS